MLNMLGVELPIFPFHVCRAFYHVIVTRKQSPIAPYLDLMLFFSHCGFDFDYLPEWTPPRFSVFPVCWLKNYFLFDPFSALQITSIIAFQQTKKIFCLRQRPPSRAVISEWQKMYKPVRFPSFLLRVNFVVIKEASSKIEALETQLQDR